MDPVGAAGAGATGEDLVRAMASRERVLRAFLGADGALVSLPAKRSKRLVVLDLVARVFEPGVRYPEVEVGALLRAFHDDVAALRRHLVDEGFMARDHGVYWRTGGTVLLDDRCGHADDRPGTSDDGAGGRR